MCNWSEGEQSSLGIGQHCLVFLASLPVRYVQECQIPDYTLDRYIDKPTSTLSTDVVKDAEVSLGTWGDQCINGMMTPRGHQQRSGTTSSTVESRQRISSRIIDGASSLCA